MWLNVLGSQACQHIKHTVTVSSNKLHDDSFILIIAVIRINKFINKVAMKLNILLTTYAFFTGTIIAHPVRHHLNVTVIKLLRIMNRYI